MSMSLSARRRALMAINKPDFFLDAAKYYQIGSNLSTSGKAAQGACYKGTTLYFITIKGDESEQYLYSLNLDSGTATLLHTYTELGHANSMTYVPSKNAFYVATQSTADGIAIIDDSDYSVRTNIVTKKTNGNAYGPWAIDYDRDSNLLYSWFSTSLMYAYDVDGQLLREIALNVPSSHTTAGGLMTDGKYFYLGWSSPNVIDVYTKSGKFLKSLSVGFTTEMEELVYTWDGRFYCMAFRQTGSQQAYALLLRAFDDNLLLSYVPSASGTLMQTRGTVTKSGNGDFTMSSTGSSNYNLGYIAAGYPFGYSDLQGKTATMEFDVERVSGTGGSVIINVFTVSSQKISNLNDRVFYYSEWIGAGTEGHKKRTLEIGGTNFNPTAAQQGSYIGYCVAFYADSGNAIKIKNFRLTVPN